MRAPGVLEIVVLVVLGLAVGSFLNVVIHRVPLSESVVRPGSHCPVCDAPVRPRDNIPVVSWLLMRAKCRDCRTPISPRYPLVEAATSGLFVASGYRFGTAWLQVAAGCVLFSCLLAVSVVDLEKFIIPDRVLFPSGGAVVALVAGAAALAHPARWHRLEDAAIGGAGAFGVFALIHLVYPAGMGFGDVKLSFPIGFFLGWVRLAVVPVGFFLAFALAALVSVGLVATGRGGRKTRIPFGPFLSLGAFGGVMWGPSIARIWLGH